MICSSRIGQIGRELLHCSIKTYVRDCFLWIEWIRRMSRENWNSSPWTSTASKLERLYNGTHPSVLLPSSDKPITTSRKEMHYSARIDDKTEQDIPNLTSPSLLLLLRQSFLYRLRGEAEPETATHQSSEMKKHPMGTKSHYYYYSRLYLTVSRRN